MHRTLQLLSLSFLCACSVTFAATRYVALDGGNTPPYTDWASAAHVIQDAVDAADDGDVVLISNGTYSTGVRITPGASLSNRVVITNSITLRSLNGPESVCIMGAADPVGDLGLGPAAVRCVFMYGGSGWPYSQSTLEGLTLSNGHTTSLDYNNIRAVGGGGVYFDSLCVISNCVVTGSRALYGGGVCGSGIALDSTVRGNEARWFGGGVHTRVNCEVHGCLVCHNSSSWHGGGFYAANSYDLITECTIVSNYAVYGGGVYSQGQLLEQCLIADNTSAIDGGGAYLYGGALSRCIISANSAVTNGGGVFAGASGVMTNCLVAGNNMADNGAGVFMQGGTAVNCTIASNTATLLGGGVYFDYGGVCFNSIIYHNVAGVSGDNWHSTTNPFTPYLVNYSCTTPTNGLPAYMCTTEAPLFYDPGADYHLMQGSPCIDAGFTYDYGARSDLDGNPRLQGNDIDMGCYEAVPEPLGGLAAVCALLCTARRRTLRG
jgi:hypothetical protein